MHLTVISAVFIALLFGDAVSGTEGGGVPEWMSRIGGLHSVILVAGLLLIAWSLMRVFCRLVLRRLEAGGHPAPPALRLPAKLDLLTRILIVVVYTTQLSAGGWANLVCAQWRLQRIVLADEVFLLLPFVMMMLMRWYCMYPVNRFIREYVVAGQLMEGVSVRPVWSRREYISFQLRHGLFIILVPLFLILATRDIVYQVAQRWFLGNEMVSAAKDVVVAGGAALIFIFSPLLLRRIWVTRPLPDGPLRERLSEFCERIKLGYRDILLWDTYSAVANAAVMGLFRPIRFVLLSDNLIENMSDEQIEAVFAHEAGHIRHHHITFMVLFLIGAGLVSELIMRTAEMLLNSRFITASISPVYRDVLVAGTALFMVIGWVLLFGLMSRRFERQADLHAAMALDPQRDSSILGHRGAYIMGTALRRIAMLNGISIETRSWRHSSVGSRMEFLQGLTMHPGAMATFRKKIWLIKFFIVVSLLIGAFGCWLCQTK